MDAAHRTTDSQGNPTQYLAPAERFTPKRLKHRFLSANVARFPGAPQTPESHAHSEALIWNGTADETVNTGVTVYLVHMAWQDNLHKRTGLLDHLIIHTP